MARQGYGHMVHDDYVARLRCLRRQRQERLQAVATVEQAREYQLKVRAKIRRAFGPWPQRAPLKVRTSGHLATKRCRIEKLVFESRPGFWVTANLYIPQGLQAPAPAVLGTCGHSAVGKAEPLYQGFCQRLAAAGFLVLIYDPINQGERDQYVLLPEREAVRSCCPAHNMMGKQLELLGEFFGAWRAWDGIRALDVLLARREVDARHVGITGNSGGGTMTTWLWPLDQRLTMAAPSCFVTTFLHNLENELPADCEQYPPGVIGAGLEMADFLIARAPAPVLLLGQHYDFFDRRGHQEACQELRRFCSLLDAPPEQVACFRGPHAHGYWRENQIEMVTFFARIAGLPPVDPTFEPTPLDPQELNATDSGQVVSAGSRPIYALIAERAEALTAQRRTLAAQEASAQELAPQLRDCLQIDGTVADTPHYRVLRPASIAGRTYGRYAIETEDRVRAILYRRMAIPQHAHSLDVAPSVTLYLPHLSSWEDLESGGPDEALGLTGELYTLDARGLGESAPDEEGSFWHPYGLDYMLHGHGLLLGQSYLGRRVHDVLCAQQLLHSEGASELRLWGRGQGAVLALFAALLDSRVGHVTLQNGPRSFQEWAQMPLVAWPAANFARDVLRHLDIPDCLEALGGRVTVLEPWGPLMQPPC